MQLQSSYLLLNSHKGYSVNWVLFLLLFGDYYGLRKDDEEKKEEEDER